VLCGLGDDAAAVHLKPPILVTTDALVEDVHFRRGWGTARQLGRKAFAVNASDIAAMGGLPVYALIDLRAPETLPVRYLEDIYRGFSDAAARHGAILIGGNTSRARQLSLGVTLLGRAPGGFITRGGCRVGDDLYVTGTLGLAALGLRALQAGRGSEPGVRRFLEPPSRVGLGLALARTGSVGGMIDISDGFLKDLGHLCAASGAGAVVEAARIPVAPTYRRACGSDFRLALAGGEDYELLFSARPGLSRRRVRLQARFRCPVSRVGRIVARPGIRVLSPEGHDLALKPGGHDHFHPRG
jgi:thiamine-monophosphate kinase